MTSTPDQPSRIRTDVSVEEIIASVREDITILGWADAFDQSVVDRVLQLVRSDPEVWFVSMNRAGKELTIFRGPHP